MAPGDALDDEMRRHSWNSVPPLDAETAERMLDGALDPQDAPPGYRDVVWVLAAASAPSPADPSAEAAARATFRSARRPVDTPRRTSVLSKLLGAKVLAALALGTASVGTAAAAATGTLPDPAQAAVHRVIPAAPSADQAEGAGDAGSAAKAGGPAADAVGLCRAYAAGRGGEQGGKLDATAFEQLTEAAGSVDIDAYCANVTAGARAGSAARAGGKTDADLAGQCRSWLAAEEQDRTATLGQAALDRLTAAAGGADSIAAYCAALVGQAPADQGPGGATSTRPTTAKAPESPGGDAPGRDAGPSRPAPTPTPRG